RFELGYWFRGWMVFIFLGIMALLFWGASYSDNVQIGGDIENTNRNAPLVIQTYFAISSILTLLMTTAFASSAATRDFVSKTNQLVFSTPMNKWAYLWGRYLGSSAAAMVPMLGVSLGVLIASAMWDNDPDQWGPNQLAPHLMGFLLFAVPNTLFTSAVIFAVAAWTRSSTVPFIAAICLLVGYGFAQNLLDDLDNEKVAMLADPLGTTAFSVQTRYWTIAERNSMTLWPTGLLLYNRLTWVGIGGLIFAAGGLGFRFKERAKAGKRIESDSEPASDLLPAAELPGVEVQDSGAGRFATVCAQFGIDFRETVRSRVFLILVAVSILNVLAALFTGAGEGFGNSALPVTYSVIETVRGATFLFAIAIVTFYSGVLVWKERESKLDEVYDAMPYPTWTTYIAKFSVMMALVLLVQLVNASSGIFYQTTQGFTRYQLGQYAFEVLLMDGMLLMWLIFLSMLCHVVSPNKYVGYFLFIVVLLGNEFLWIALDVPSLMVNYGARPSYVYSDFIGFGPFLESIGWFAVYWTTVGVLLAVATVLLWQRGKETRYSRRFSAASQRLSGPVFSVACVAALGTTVSGSWIFYNTHMLNVVRSSTEQKDLVADYEKTYRKYVDLVQPRITDVRYDIDLYPSTRSISFRGQQTIKNKSEQPIEEVHFSFDTNYEHSIDLPDSTLVTDDARLGYRIYDLDEPMQPGESREMSFEVAYAPQGFAQSTQVMQIMTNGSFFNNQLAPQIGYQPNAELSVRSDRRKRDLGEPNRMAELHADCGPHCSNTYISNNSDWVDVETFISTSSDQIAIAPGSLIREWTEDGRRHFHYKVDHPSLNFYSFMSADYEVKRDEVLGIDLEVYYHPEHHWNVDKMLNSMRKSLDYYSKNFGPYRHNQARIIEFPRWANFAQAFPGTMPYSEGIGFIADLDGEDSIDMVFYVVAHEMAHQWWAHQVIGARVEGATLLSETLAQYSALMVMEREYGRDKMRKFLRYEMDRYLRSRGSDALREEPLTTVDASQGYVHYRKGSVVLYYLKEMIGEDKVNAALRELVNKYAYKDPPYPTSLELIAALRKQTPSDKQYLLRDLFEQITLFDNRAVAATYKPTEDGRFEVTLEFETKKLVADADGEESEVEMDDFVEVGAFAKPEDGRKYGKTLYRESMKLSSGKHTHTFITDERPDEVGVDPFALLIDRVGDDNVRRPKAK
ncbi:MAG: M1 family aminopeptidase, partial [Planctomycetota bacterium]